MSTVLLLGFLLGLRHALESDHIAAVATLVARQRSLARMLVQGAVWGLGHAATLFTACSVVLFADLALPERAAPVLETLVGAMLIALGVDVLLRLRRDHIHFHFHRHVDGTLHLHAHSHAGEAGHDPLHHEHAHARGFPLRALAVGMVHGLAGSAALLLLTVESAGSAVAGLAYVALFGLGATAGMVALTAALALPLGWSARSLGWLNRALQGAAGVLSLALGGLLLAQNLPAAATVLL